jgi:hypothetical protein
MPVSKAECVPYLPTLVQGREYLPGGFLKITRPTTFSYLAEKYVSQGFSGYSIDGAPYIRGEAVSQTDRNPVFEGGGTIFDGFLVGSKNIQEAIDYLINNLGASLLDRFFDLFHQPSDREYALKVLTGNPESGKPDMSVLARLETLLVATLAVGRAHILRSRTAREYQAATNQLIGNNALITFGKDGSGRILESLKIPLSPYQHFPQKSTLEAVLCTHENPKCRQIVHLLLGISEIGHPLIRTELDSFKANEEIRPSYRRCKFLEGQVIDTLDDYGRTKLRFHPPWLHN